MENSTISSNGQKLLEFLDSKMYDGDFTNEDLVQFIEQVGRYLGLQTIPNYAKENKLSYNGVKKFRKIKKILNVKFVIDNLKRNNIMKKQERTIEEAFLQVQELVEAQDKALKTADSLLGIKDCIIEILEDQKKICLRNNKFLRICLYSLVALNIITSIIDLL